MIYDFKAKAANTTQLNNYMLTKTLSMFEWENLPETIPAKELERLLQVNGFAFITEVEGSLYAFAGGLGGVCDVYGNPTEITISNPALNFNKTLNLKEDGVLICNDDLKIGLIPLFQKHNSMLVENDINMVLHGYATRMQHLISASDDRTKDSAENYIRKIIAGDVSVIAETALFDGVKIHSAPQSQGNITQLTEFHQYIKASLYNEIGLSATFNMRRERLIAGEVKQSEDSLFPYVYNMLANRLLAVKAINDMFGTDIDVDFGSVWNLKNRELVDGIVNNEIVDVVTLEDVPEDVPEGEPEGSEDAPEGESEGEPEAAPEGEPEGSEDAPEDAPEDDSTDDEGNNDDDA